MNYAGLTSRVAAYTVDVILLCGGILASQSLLRPINPLLDGPGLAWRLHAWVFLTVTVPVWIYFTAFCSVPPHATPGMRLVKADPRWQEAMRRRGITDLDSVAVSASAPGDPPGPGAQRARIYRSMSFYQAGTRNVLVSYVGGFATIPAPVREACRELVATRFPQRLIRSETGSSLFA